MDIPEAGCYIWKWFFEIKRCGDVNAAGIIAWQRLSGNVIYPCESEILIEMSVAFDNAMRKMQRDIQERSVKDG